MAKNKMKTRKAAAKRFSFTATGKIRYKKTQQSSNTPLSKSSGRTKRAQRLGGELAPGDANMVREMVPYFRKRK
jgi:large subunit ribosomal protein L35